MEIILRLVCGDALGGRIDREDAIGRQVMVAAVVRDGDGLVVRLAPSPANIGLETFDGLRGRDCTDLRRKLEGLGAVVAPND